MPPLTLLLQAPVLKLDRKEEVPYTPGLTPPKVTPKEDILMESYNNISP
jgi:hypothetical protein